MSKLKDTLLMMAEQKENFKIGDKTFQIIEVKEAEKSQPDYSHLVGKWVRCLRDGTDKYQGRYYQVKKVTDSKIYIKDEVEVFKWNFDGSGVRNYFDLTNPQDSNPDEVEKILVPSEIGIYNWSDGVLAIGFGENQLLFCSSLAKSYWVGHEHKNSCNPIQCELIKCERAELNKGDIAFRCDEEQLLLNNLFQYCVIVNGKDYCFIHDNKNVELVSVFYEHWYKLQPIQ